jgi:hypothetical protein
MTQSIPELNIAASVFNLHMESCEDGERVAREAAELRQREREAAEYQNRMQRTFEQCPGFIGAEAPAGPGCSGRVTFEPSKALEAIAWLKRRFRVDERLDLSTDSGLCVEVISKRKPVLSGQCNSRRVHFGKTEQFQLSL